MNWKYLGGACILGGGLALKMGAPLVTVIAGIVLAVVWNLWNNRERRA